MATYPPPELAQWVRDTNRTLTDLQRQINRLTAKVSGVTGDVTVAATEAGAITAPNGMTSGWARKGDGLGPTVAVHTTTGLVVVLVSAHVHGIWPSLVTAAALGSMCVAVDDQFDTSTDLSAEQVYGLGSAFKYVTGDAGELAVSGTSVRLLNLAPGTHRLYSEYLYSNATAGLQIEWSNRTITAIPL